jgi:hypothetical protein
MKQKQEQETQTDQPRTIRDSSDGQLKTIIPNPASAAQEEGKKAEVTDGKVS